MVICNNYNDKRGCVIGIMESCYNDDGVLIYCRCNIHSDSMDDYISLDKYDDDKKSMDMEFDSIVNYKFGNGYKRYHDI